MFSNIYVTLKLPWDTPMSCPFCISVSWENIHTSILLSAWSQPGCMSVICVFLVSGSCGAPYTPTGQHSCAYEGFSGFWGNPWWAPSGCCDPNKCTSCDWGQLPDQGLWSKSSMLAFVPGEQPLSNPSCVPLVLLSPGHWGFWLQTRMRMKPIRKSLWDVDPWGLFVCGLTPFILACPVLLKSGLPWVVGGALGSQYFCFDWKSLPCYYQMEHMGVLWPCFANTFQVSAQYRELLLRPCFSASVLASSVTSAFFGCRMEFAAKNQ